MCQSDSRFDVKKLEFLRKSENKSRKRMGQWISWRYMLWILFQVAFLIRYDNFHCFMEFLIRYEFQDQYFYFKKINLIFIEKNTYLMESIQFFSL